MLGKILDPIPGPLVNLGWPVPTPVTYANQEQRVTLQRHLVLAEAPLTQLEHELDARLVPVLGEAPAALMSDVRDLPVTQVGGDIDERLPAIEVVRTVNLLAGGRTEVRRTRDDSRVRLHRLDRQLGLDPIDHQKVATVRFLTTTTANV